MAGMGVLTHQDDAGTIALLALGHLLRIPLFHWMMAGPSAWLPLGCRAAGLRGNYLLQLGLGLRCG